MFGKAIVGVDESNEGRDAIALAKQLVARGGKLTLAHVVTTSAWEPLAYRAANAAGAGAKSGEREHAEELLRTAHAQAGNAFGRSAISTKVVWSPSVGRGLHELADIEDADLLVLGSSRRGMLGRVLVGDHTRAALNGAPCAVAVAPAGYCDHFGAVRRIGVGYDGIARSEHGARGRQAARRGTSRGTLGLHGGDGSAADDRTRSAAAQRRDRAALTPRARADRGARRGGTAGRLRSAG